MILLDEPSLGLAPQLVDQVFDQIGTLKEQGLAILLVEQNAARALDIAHRGYVLELGRNKYEGEGRKLLAEGKAALRNGRIDALIDADMRFHLWVCDVAGNPLLLEAMRLYWNHLRRAMGEALRDPAAQKRIWEEHEAVLRTIAARDPVAASRSAGEHAREAGKTMARAIPTPSARALRGIIPLRPTRPPKGTSRHKA